MKKIFFLLVFALSTLAARASDICGCSVGGPYFGVLPQYHRHVAGLRWYDSRFDTQHPASHHGETHFSQDRFRTMELWGRFYPLPRLQVLGTLPLHFLQSEGAGSMNRSSGLGDATLLASYAVVNDIRCGAWRHQWQLGGGLKLPTGRFEPAFTDDPGLQRGTGSWDWLAATNYTLRFRKWGFNTDAAYRISGKSPGEYRFGNRLVTGARVFYWKEWKKGPALLPNAGILFEAAQKDLQKGERLYYTGGNCLMATAGADVYLKNLTLGATLKMPLSQHLAEGYTQAQERLVLHLAWMF